MILLDTHVLLWWILAEDMLSTKAKLLLENTSSEKIIVNSISFWEIFIKEKKKKLNLGITAKEFAHRVSTSGKIKILNSDFEIFHRAVSLNWMHKDPVDRILVATAKQRGLALLSKDKEIKKYYKKTIW